MFKSWDVCRNGIFRYKRALAKDSFIGGFYTARERKSGFNRVFGLDGQLRISRSSIFGYNAFKSQGKLNEGSPRDDGHAIKLHYSYNTKSMILMLGLLDISKEFRTETGYITRTGITMFRSGLQPMFYPKSKIIQRIDPMIHSTQTRDKFSGLYETFNSFDLRLILLRDSYILAGYQYATEVFLDEKFNTSTVRMITSSQFTKQFFFKASFLWGL